MPEQQLLPMQLTLREIALISELRTIAFGTIEIKKENNQIERMISKRNKLITERDGLTAMQRHNNSIAFIDKTIMIEAVR